MESDSESQPEVRAAIFRSKPVRPTLYFNIHGSYDPAMERPHDTASTIFSLILLGLNDITFKGSAQDEWSALQGLLPVRAGHLGSSGQPDTELGLLWEPTSLEGHRQKVQTFRPGQNLKTVLLV